MTGTGDKAESLPTQIAGRYRVEGLLGRGGMGAVYRAVDERSGGVVALKCQRDAEDAHLRRQLRDMFRREYRTLQALKHPSVIQVYDYGVTDSGPYYTMELLGGEDLHVMSPLPWKQVCGYMRHVCSSLSLLHSRRLLHRDISPRNVRCDGDAAKLIDFGAMAAMGPCAQLVGTPPLMPPEALERQSLDGRSDLYAVGATLYWALTGRHAYPARNLAMLPTLWKQPPAAPSAVGAGVPPALDALVLALLSANPNARPSSAAEVMERLSAIAGLQDPEGQHVSNAYLATPALLAREDASKAVQAALRRVGESHSAHFVLTGEEGVGRSRMLDAALIEARLEGAEVLRLQASDLPQVPDAVAPALLERISERLTSEVAAVHRTSRVPTAMGPSPQLEATNRAGLMSRVRARLRRLTQGGAPVVVAVDDLQALDASSQALIATLPAVVRGGLLVLSTHTLGAALEPLLEARLQEAERYQLAPLAETETEALFASVFGQVPGLARLSARVHRLSHGNPRASLELAQHLVDRGTVHYALGRWVLPADLSDEDLPDAWTQAIGARLAQLDDDAMALAQLLAFAVEYSKQPGEIDALVAQDRARREPALDALVVAGEFLVDGPRYGFSSGAHAEHLREQLDETRAVELHRELCRWLQVLGRDGIEVARCALRADESGAAIDALLGELTGTQTRWHTSPTDYADILQASMAACERLGRPRRERFRLLQELVQVGEHMGVADMRRHFAELFAQLRADGVLDAHDALPDTLDPGERLSQAFAATQARYDALPEHERVLPPVEGLRALAMAVRQASAFGAVSMDYEIHASLPSLEPFAPLSPAIASTLVGTLPGGRHLTAGRYEEAYTCYERTLRRLEEPDRAGLDEEYCRWACGALRYALGHIHAGLGIESALEHATAMEADEAWSIPAWDVRRAYYLRLGSGQDAEACRARIERMLLESGQRPPMVDTSARLELDVAAHAGDLPAAQRAVERMRGLVDLHPGYAPYRHYGPAVIALLRGHHEEALQRAELALAMVEPGKHPTWPWIANCVLDALLAMGRFEEAVERGQRLLAQAQANDLGVMMHHLSLPLAMAEARLGDTETALQRVEVSLAHVNAIGSRGLDLGWVQEHRARLAIWMGDSAAFNAAAACCAREYGKGREDSSLVGRYERLRTEARAAGMGTPSMLPPRMPREVRSTLNTSFAYTMLQAPTEAERFEVALKGLMAESEARAGQLYVCAESGLELCASVLGDVAPPGPEALARTAQGRTVLDRDDDDEEDEDDDDIATVTQAGDDGDGEGGWWPMDLGYVRTGGRFHRTGVAMLHFDKGPAPVSLELVEALGHVLDGTPVTGTVADASTAATRIDHVSGDRR